MRRKQVCLVQGASNRHQRTPERDEWCKLLSGGVATVCVNLLIDDTQILGDSCAICLTVQWAATAGMKGAKLKGDDSVDDIVQCMDHDSVLFFTSEGSVYSLKAHQIPQASRTAIGTAVTQVCLHAHAFYPSVTTQCRILIQQLLITVS